MIKTNKLFAMAALAGIVGGQAFYAAAPGLAADDNSTTTSGNKTSCSGKSGCKGNATKTPGDKSSCSAKNSCNANKTAS